MLAGSNRAFPPGLRESEGAVAPAVQKLFPFARPLSSRVRSIRRPFHPSQDASAYRLPHDIRDRLAGSLAPFRNRETAYALAVFVSRFWSMPGRVAGAFPIDRRALADRRDLALTEARVRGAIKTLEAVGFLDRAIPDPGSKYKAVGEGLHRKPILFVFGSDYGPAFIAANKRAAAARGRASRTRGSNTAETTRRPVSGLPSASNLKSPKCRSETDRLVIMGEVRKGIGLPPKTFVPDANLEAALERLRQGVIGKAGDA
jgi:hypothetical protein